MLKHFLFLLGTVLCLAGTPLNAFAAPKTALAAAQALSEESSLFYVKDDELFSYGISDSTFLTELCSAVNTVFRACDASEMGRFGALYKTNEPDILYFKLTEDQLAILADNQALVDAWAESAVPSIVPQETDLLDAIWLCYSHVVTAYAPDYNAMNDTGDLRRQAQGAAYVLKNGSGICAGLSRLFRACVEAIPLNPQTLTVDYSAQEPFHLRVAIVENISQAHAWAAICMADTWYFYDLSILNLADLKERYQMSESQLNPDDYGQPDDFIWLY